MKNTNIAAAARIINAFAQLHKVKAQKNKCIVRLTTNNANQHWLAVMIDTGDALKLKFNGTIVNNTNQTEVFVKYDSISSINGRTEAIHVNENHIKLIDNIGAETQIETVAPDGFETKFFNYLDQPEGDSIIVDQFQHIVKTIGHASGKYEPSLRKYQTMKSTMPISIKNNKMRIYQTDGRRMAYIEKECDTPSQDKCMAVSNTVSIINKINHDGKVEIYSKLNINLPNPFRYVAWVKGDSFTLMTPIENTTSNISSTSNIDNFINSCHNIVSQAIGDSLGGGLKINTHKVAEWLKTLKDKNKEPIVTIKHTDGFVSFTQDNHSLTIETDTCTAYLNKELTFNKDFLKDMLTHTEEKTVSWQFTKTGMLLHTEGFFEIIMPLVFNKPKNR